MNRHDITSGLFRSAGFDPTCSILELEYSNGTCRRWLAVPTQIYQGFCSASDPDTFFRHHIEGRYSSLHGESVPFKEVESGK
ncbi:KTSC domain-containing protein [Pantoea sp. At-9b]|uniref:KTSC domain-containing protein n=1 Tax=Pantoea sp. (strain At-9b) TaxID=592316 RepID=UPI0001B4043A|nr:KTSC domain-containing protein [Pantoea sp. At-9b]ADU72117.1 hypothetical protein Pat9b_4789 [Pantoea sp. At-9b]